MNPATDATRNLAWKLNWWRQSELEGALLLGRLVGKVDDRDLVRKLTRHSAEEAAHSSLWAEVIAELDLPGVRIFRSYQSFYLRYSGPPASLLDVLCFTQVFERRVHTRFHAELQRADTPEPARAAYRRMMEDEKDHLAWVAEWLRREPGAEERLEFYRRIDRVVFREIEPFAERIWDVPGLGAEQSISPSESLVHVP